jgi:hypothetical protein
MAFRLTGTEPYQVPTNADLGSMAFQDAAGIAVGTANIQYLFVNGGDMTNIQVLDDISFLFDGTTTTFRLSVDNFTVVPAAAEQLLINVGGTVISPFINTIDNVFLPVTDSLGFNKGYVVNSNGSITFASAPLMGMDFDGRMLNTSQTRAANRSYPFKPLSLAYSDY